MVKDFLYIIKRILIGVGIALVLMALKGNLFIGVSARTISMDIPDNFGYYTTNGQNTQNTLTSQQASLNNYVNIPSYRSQLIPQNSHGGLAYEWVNANLCVNDDLTISGVVHAPTITSVTWASGYFNSWTEQKSCDMFTVSNGYRFTCSGTGGGGFVVYFGYQNDNGYGGYMYLERDMDIYCNATANDIISNANNNTTQIINNNNENTQQIIQSITGGAEATIESQKVCNITHIDKSNVIEEGKFINNNGALSSANGMGVTDYFDLSYIKSLKVLISANYNVGFYDNSKSFISVYPANQTGDLSIPQNARFARFSINLGTNKPQFDLEICKNGNQALQDSLTDDSGVSNSDIEDLFGDLETSDTPISDLLTMPITLLNAYISGMSGTCQSINLGQLYGSYLILPCIDLEDYLGSSLWSLIDTLFSLYLIYNIAMLFVTSFDGLTSLKDDFGSLYSPRHAGGGSTRVERNSDLY